MLFESKKNMFICETCKCIFYSNFTTLRYCFHCFYEKSLMDAHNIYIRNLEKIYNSVNGNLYLYGIFAKYIVKPYVDHNLIKKIYL